MTDIFTGGVEGFPAQTEEVLKTKKNKTKQNTKNCSMKSFWDLVYLGHYKVTMGHHLLLRLPKGSLKHWTLLIIIFTVPLRPQSSEKVERGEGPPKITRKVLQRNRPPNNYKASGLLLSHLPIKQLPRSSKSTAGPACPNDLGPTQDRTGRWISLRCQFLKGISTY